MAPGVHGSSVQRADKHAKHIVAASAAARHGVRQASRSRVYREAAFNGVASSTAAVVKVARHGGRQAKRPRPARTAPCHEVTCNACSAALTTSRVVLKSQGPCCDASLRQGTSARGRQLHLRALSETTFITASDSRRAA